MSTSSTSDMRISINGNFDEAQKTKVDLCVHMCMYCLLVEVNVISAVR